MRIALNVKGMRCHGCETLVRDELSEMGAKDVSVKLAPGGVSEVSFSATETDAAATRKKFAVAIEALGYRVA